MFLQSKKCIFAVEIKLIHCCMDRLFSTYGRLLAATNLHFTRYLYEQINWDNKLIVIKVC